MDKLQYLFNMFKNAADKCSCASHAPEIQMTELCAREKLWRAYCNERDTIINATSPKVFMTKQDALDAFNPEVDTDLA